MKLFLLLMTVSLFGFCGLANAQCNSDPNEIGIFWTEDCGECVNCLDFVGGIVMAYVVLINSTQAAGVSGFEFCLTNADGTTFNPPIGSSFVTGYNYPPESVNASSQPCFIVGIASPLPWSPCITLITINVLVVSPEAWCFGVKPAQPASIPGQMVYADGADPGLLLPMYPNNGSDASGFAMACLNQPDCPPGPIRSEERAWGGVKALYR